MNGPPLEAQAQLHMNPAFNAQRGGYADGWGNHMGHHGMGGHPTHGHFQYTGGHSTQATAPWIQQPQHMSNNMGQMVTNIRGALTPVYGEVKTEDLTLAAVDLLMKRTDQLAMNQSRLEQNWREELTKAMRAVTSEFAASFSRIEANIEAKAARNEELLKSIAKKQEEAPPKQPQQPQQQVHAQLPSVADQTCSTSTTCAQAVHLMRAAEADKNLMIHKIPDHVLEGTHEEKTMGVAAFLAQYTPPTHLMHASTEARAQSIRSSIRNIACLSNNTVRVSFISTTSKMAVKMRAYLLQHYKEAKVTFDHDVLPEHRSVRKEKREEFRRLKNLYLRPRWSDEYPYTDIIHKKEMQQEIQKEDHEEVQEVAQEETKEETQEEAPPLTPNTKAAVILSEGVGKDLANILEEAIAQEENSKRKGDEVTTPNAMQQTKHTKAKPNTPAKMGKGNEMDMSPPQKGNGSATQS